LSNSLANHNGSPAVSLGSATPWTPIKNFLGFDPFQSLRAQYGFEYDVTRTDRGYEIEVPVPGYTSEDIDVSLQDDVLTISGKSDHRSFSRTMVIPDDVDNDSISASVKNGMLYINLERRPEAQPKKITVKQDL
jgi:HSP20 family protein